MAFPDALLTRGLYQHRPELPFVPGGEVAGVVRSAPAGAQVKPGDRVAALTMLSGGMAEVVRYRNRCSSCPTTVSLEAGAGLLFNDLTVDFALAPAAGSATARRCSCTAPPAGSARRRCDWRPAFGAARTIAVVSTEDKVEVAVRRARPTSWSWTGSTTRVK